MRQATTGMTGEDRSSKARLLGRFLGHDDPADLALVAALFVLYFTLDQLTIATARLNPDDVDRFSLIGAAVINRWWAVAALTAVLVTAAALAPKRLVAGWDSLPHGTTFRLMAVPLIALMVWQGAFYDDNFLTAQTHDVDRALVVVLGLASLWRPGFVIPFVLVHRIVGAQILLPFGFTTNDTIDDLPRLALLAFAAAYLLRSLVERLGPDWRSRYSTAPVLLVVGAATAAHYFVPGQAKLAVGWLQAVEPWNLPLAANTAGWLGATDGRISETFASVIRTLHWPVLIGTIVLEVGALVAVLHPKMLRIWLAGFVMFQVVLFIGMGYFFFGWALVQLGLLLVLSLPRLSGWVSENVTPARSVLAALTVATGAVLYHPPGPSWFDTPVSYGYEMEAIGESGTTYRVPVSAFAPHDQLLSFTILQFSDRAAASGSHGATSVVEELPTLQAITTFAELDAYEATLGEPGPSEASEQFILNFVDYVNAERRRGWAVVGPPDRYWTSSPDPVFDFQEPIVRLDVIQVRSLHAPNGEIDPIFDRNPVFAVEVDSSGRAVPATP